MGKTVTTEFALFHPGKTANPRDVARTPGGSSSGSAAAVVDCMVPVALGTQTAGSIIRPASYCGTFGFKPTFGALSRARIREISPTLDTLGHFARTVDDLALVANVLAGHDSADPATAEPTHVRFDTVASDQQWPRRIAFVPTSHWDRADPRARARIEEAITGLNEVDVDEVSLPPEFDELVDAQISIMEREAFRSLRDEWERNPELISSELAALLERGRDVSKDVYEAALERAIVCRRRLHQMFDHYDFVITPSVLGEAPIGLQSTGDPLFCRMWTLLGAPAVAVPGLIGPDGLPLGVQVIGPLHRDEVALAAAEWLSERLSLSFTPPQTGSERK
jgi:Asp-tRNA(Asn)/Glu-tRNA(Gln) amidotransferase A subunit family amidase